MRRHITVWTILTVSLLAGLLVVAVPAEAAPLPNFVIPATATAGNCGTLTPITGGCELRIAGTYTDPAGNDFRIEDQSTLSNKAKIQSIDCNPICKLILSGVNVVASENVTNAAITYSHTFNNNTNSTSLRVRHEETGGFSFAFQPTNTVTRTATFTAQVNSAIAPQNVASLLSSGPFPIIPRTNATFTSSTSTALTVTGTVTINILKSGEKSTSLVDTIQTGPQANLPADVGNLEKCFLDQNPTLTPLPGTIVRGDALDGSEDRICYVTELSGMQLLTGVEALGLAAADQGDLSSQELHAK